MADYTRLQNLLCPALEAVPERIAIRASSTEISYAELDRQVRVVAAGLRAQGVQSGDRVAWFLPNCLEAVTTTLACYQLGAIAVPLNNRYVAQEARDVLERITARVLVFAAERRDVVQPLLDSNLVESAFQVGGGGDGSVSSFDALLDYEPLVEQEAVDAQHPALILFTSGSTGHPKGVVHSHRGAFSGIDISRRIFDFQRDDIVLVGKPITHAGGLQTQLMPTLLVGGEVILAMKPEPAKAASLIDAHAVSEYGMLASDLLDFVEYLEESHATRLPTLKNCIGSGDSVPVDLHHRFRDLLGWEVMEGAGMTEVGGYYAANPRYGSRKWGSLGLPTPDTELRIVDERGVECPPGEMGEIAIRSPSATIGYWQDPTATAELFQDGWLHTGDLAHRDGQGYVWFVGRKKLMIVRRGSNIAPAEVEDVLDEHPQIHASVVVGVHDRQDGQVPVACVSRLHDTEAVTEDELRDFVSDRLAAYKNPARYFFFDELPRNSTGKFDRHHLQEAAERAMAGGESSGNRVD